MGQEALEIAFEHLAVYLNFSHKNANGVELETSVNFPFLLPTQPLRILYSLIVQECQSNLPFLPFTEILEVT